MNSADHTHVLSKTIDDAPMTPFLRKVTFFSSGGAFLDGYVLSLIGVALLQLTPALSLSQSDTAAIGAAALAGIFFGSLIGGRLTDVLGRRKMFIIDVLAIMGCSLLGTIATDMVLLVLSRFLIGLFIGADYPIATSLIAEFTPKHHRAIAMGIVATAWYVGATVAALVGWMLFPVEEGWRWMLGSAVVPCVLLLIGRSDIPESPRWLLQKGRQDEAHAIVERVFGPGVELDEVPGKQTSIRRVCRGVYGRRTAFMCVMILCQVVPMYAIYTFGPELMAAFGFSHGRDAILGESVVSLFFLVGSIPAMFWLNSLGRRRLLLIGNALMFVGLFALGVYPQAPVLFVMAAFGVYAFFSGGPGILQWLYPNELFPTEVRATAVGVAIAASRIGVVISTYALPLFLDAYGVGTTMLIAAALVAVGFVWAVIESPETKGMSLSESSSVSSCEKPRSRIS